MDADADEASALAELIAAHAAHAQLSAEVAAARERRRSAARRLLALGRTRTWIGKQIDMSPQGVASFLRGGPDDGDD